MRILYFGIPLGALALARAGFPPAAAVVGPLDLPGRRRLRRTLPRALLLGLPNLDVPEVQATLRSTEPDLVLSFFWPRRIPAEVLGWAPALGTHPSLLPRWRGPDPYYWAIAAGDTKTGVTLHRLGSEYDTGPIVAQTSVAIEPDDDAWSLAKRLDRPALALLIDAARRRAQGDPLLGTPQDPAGVTWAPVPRAEDLAIDWRQPAETIARRVRAAAPRPGATAQLGGAVVRVLRVALARETPPPGLMPAEAWRGAEGWCVRCGAGALRLLDVRDDDDRPLDPSAQLAGY